MFLIATIAVSSLGLMHAHLNLESLVLLFRTFGHNWPSIFCNFLVLYFIDWQLIKPCHWPWSVIQKIRNILLFLQSNWTVWKCNFVVTKWEIKTSCSDPDIKAIHNSLQIISLNSEDFKRQRIKFKAGLVDVTHWEYVCFGVGLPNFESHHLEWGMSSWPACYCFILFSTKGSISIGE